MLKLIRKFTGNQSGQFALMFSLLSFPLLASAGLAVDYASLSSQRGHIQNANDAAALWAADYYRENNRLPSPLDTKAFIISNFPEEYGMEVGLPRLSRQGKQVVVDAQVTLNTYIMQAFGAGFQVAKVTSAAAVDVDTILEFALALDTTGSMNRDGRIQGLKQAANNFITKVWQIVEDGADVKGAIVPFSNYVNVGTQYRSAPWTNVPADVDDSANGRLYTWNGVIGSLPYPRNLQDTGNQVFPGPLGDRAGSPILPLTDNEGRLKDAINGLVARGMTYIPDGMMWALRTLSPEAPFTEGRPVFTGQTGQTRIRKVIILMTDGENTTSPNYGAPQTPPLTGNAYRVRHNGGNWRTANAYTTEACNYVKNKEYEVFTITFGTTVSNTVQDLMKDCASSPDNYYKAVSSSDLDAAFDKIADSLIALRLTQ